VNPGRRLVACATGALPRRGLVGVGGWVCSAPARFGGGEDGRARVGCFRRDVAWRCIWLHARGRGLWRKAGRSGGGVWMAVRMLVLRMTVGFARGGRAARNARGESWVFGRGMGFYFLFWVAEGVARAALFWRSGRGRIGGCGGVAGGDGVAALGAAAGAGAEVVVAFNAQSLTATSGASDG